MPHKKRRARRSTEFLVRFVNITGVSVGVSISAAQERGEEPHITSLGQIELTGTMDEPVRDTRDVEIAVYAADDPKPGSSPVPWIRLVHGMRPVMRPAIFISHPRFRPGVVAGPLRSAQTRLHGFSRHHATSRRMFSTSRSRRTRRSSEHYVTGGEARRLPSPPSLVCKWMTSRGHPLRARPWRNRKRLPTLGGRLNADLCMCGEPLLEVCVKRYHQGQLA